MTWVFFVLTSVVFLSLTNILQRALMKKQDSNPIVYATIFQLFCTLIVGSIAFARGFIMPPVSEFPFNFLLLALLYAGMNFFLFKAYQTTEASNVTILMSSRALWTIAVALLFLGETFTITKILGTVIILLAVFLVTKRQKDFRISKGELYILAAALCLGVASANDAYILRTAEPFSFTVFAFLFPSLVLLALHPKTLIEAKQFLNKNLVWKLIILSLVFSIAVLASSLAYAYGALASQAAPIQNSAVILTVLLATIFLKERDNLIKKFLAAILVVVGVSLLT